MDSKFDYCKYRYTKTKLPIVCKIFEWNQAQAWYLMEAIASVAPGLCLGALSKVPIEIYKFLIEVPFAKEKSPCPFKYEVSGLCLPLRTCLSFDDMFVFN